LQSDCRFRRGRLATSSRVRSTAVAGEVHSSRSCLAFSPQLYCAAPCRLYNHTIELQLHPDPRDACRQAQRGDRRRIEPHRNVSGAPSAIDAKGASPRWRNLSASLLFPRGPRRNGYVGSPPVALSPMLLHVECEQAPPMSVERRRRRGNGTRELLDKGYQNCSNVTHSTLSVALAAQLRRLMCPTPWPPSSTQR
jgi:hypothetical protein